MAATKEKNSGKFGTFVRSQINKKNENGLLKSNTSEFNYFAAKDRRMRFNNSKDPIYYVFDCIENRPIKTLAKEFVKDSLFEITNFVSKVVR